MDMEMNFIRQLPTPQEIKEQFPLKPEIVVIKNERDEIIRDIFTGKDDRFLLIIGPCSADNEPAVLDYMTRLAKVQEKVKDKIFIIPRVYTNKPRTKGTGYKGMLHQPDTSSPVSSRTSLHIASKLSSPDTDPPPGISHSPAAHFLSRALLVIRNRPS